MAHNTDVLVAEARLTCLGETTEIGASCHFIEIDGTGIMFDAGADPEHEGTDSLPDLHAVEARSDAWVDHVVVSHAHHDHLGALPVVIQRFPHVMVHMTKATRDLADVLLPASARLQKRRIREGSSTAEPLFGQEELEAYGYLYMTHGLDRPFDLTGIRGRTRVEGRLHDAGHVLGAVGVELEIGGDSPRRLFYTSDTSLRPQAILPGADYPPGPFDTLMLECTLGADPDAEQTTRKTEEMRFGEALAKTLSRGGTALVPVFALGRGQEVIAMVERFMRRGIIDPDTPVYSAGMMRAISDIYDRTRFSTPRLNEEFQVYGVEQRRMPRNENRIREVLSEPGILVVGSGMMFERTISNRIAQEMVEHDKHSVLLVGYARDDSPARRLIDAEGAEPEVVIDRHRGPQPLRCTVERFRFSGHSHRRDLIGLVERLSPKRVILVHGESKAREWMADNIRYFHPDVTVVNPARGESVALFNDD